MTESEKNELRSWSNDMLREFLVDINSAIKKGKVKSNRAADVQEAVAFVNAELNSRLLKLVTK